MLFMCLCPLSVSMRSFAFLYIISGFRRTTATHEHLFHLSFEIETRHYNHMDDKRCLISIKVINQESFHYSAQVTYITVICLSVCMPGNNAEARVISADDISMQPCGNQCPLLMIMRAVLCGFEAATWAYFAQTCNDFARHSFG